MKFYAMLDDQSVQVVVADSFNEAFDKEPPNTHWLFSEEGLREFLVNAQAALKETK